MAELRVWRVNLGYLRSFFLPPFLIDFFYLFYHSTLYWLRIELYNLFWLVFYWVISVSWSKFIMLTRVDLDFFFYPFLINCFSISSFNIRLIENWLSKYIFYLFSMRLLRSCDLDREFKKNAVFNLFQSNYVFSSCSSYL
jgi:hypothetical protein